MSAPFPMSRAGRVPLPNPLPILLVLEPTMGGWPWSHAIAHALSTLQAFDTPHFLHDPGLGATWNLAVELQSVEEVVVCVEGVGPPMGDRVSQLTAFLRALDARLDTTRTALGVPLPLGSVWFDARVRRLHALAWDTDSGTALRADTSATWTRRLVDACAGGTSPA